VDKILAAVNSDGDLLKFFSFNSVQVFESNLLKFCETKSPVALAEKDEVDWLRKSLEDVTSQKMEIYLLIYFQFTFCVAYVNA
jgi:hypothetical protein